MLYNIYCDESCHLEHDGQKYMVLGALWLPTDQVRKVSIELRDLKKHYGFQPTYEMKWVKVSHSSRFDFFKAVVDYFFNNPELHFRAVVIDKTKLDHEGFDQTHDTWYYKMLFLLMKVIIDPGQEYSIYLDIKDTRSEEKVKKLKEVICKSYHDFQQESIHRIQQIQSHQSEQLQLTDLLIGAVQYANRNELHNLGKVQIVEQIRNKSGFSLTSSTYIGEQKFNLIKWEPRGQYE